MRVRFIKTGPVSSELIRKGFCSECARENFDPKASKRIFHGTTQRGFCTAAGVVWDFPPEHFTVKERKFCVDVVEVLLYVDINRFIRDPPSTSTFTQLLSSEFCDGDVELNDLGCRLTY